MVINGLKFQNFYKIDQIKLYIKLVRQFKDYQNKWRPFIFILKNKIKNNS